MKFRRKPKEKLDITLISMIDVVFVLLLFFVVSTHFNKQHGISIQLPEANTQKTQEQNKSVTLIISAQGSYFLETEDGSARELPDQKPETLMQFLQERAKDSADYPFVIKADDKTPHQYVVTALDIAGQVGFSHITFATQEPNDKE